jgi:hypothetical protein
MSAFLLAGLLICAGASDRPPDAPSVVLPANWRRRATEDDSARLRGIRDAWVVALAQARADHAAQIDAGGILFDPDAAMLDPQLPVGDYDCRTIKLGAQTSGRSTYVAYPVAHCRVGPGPEGTLSFVRLDGVQRPIGRLFPDTRRRMIFLGTVQLGDEQRAYRYGADDDRDQAAVLERIGERRWRLVFPRPHFESMLDVIELVPRGGR